MLKFIEFIKENANVETLAIKIEKLFYTLDTEKQKIMQDILGKYLILDKKKNKVYSPNDVILVEYWYNHTLTPVKVLEKKGHKYLVTHNISDSQIKNAPNELIHKDKVIDFYFKQEKDENKLVIDPDVRLKNAIETLHPFIQKKLYNEINNILNENEEVLSDKHIYGKGVFNTFLKVLSALNMSADLKKITDKCPKDFIYFYQLNDIDANKIKNVMKRFRSLEDILEDINCLYFGLKYSDKLYLSYGYMKGEETNPIGQFYVNNTVLNEIIETNNKYLHLLKKDMDHIKNNTNHIKKLSRLKNDISTFSPSYYKEKTHPYIDNDMLIIKYYGVGKWESGNMLEADLAELKKSFKEWAINKKYNDIAFKALAHDFRVTFKIKFSIN